MGSTTTYYFYGLTGLMSEFSTSTSQSSATQAASTDRIQYRVGEQTGTAVMLVDPDGTPRENNRVFPFGEPWLAFVASSNSEKFTTYQHDGESDLDYAMARYYASRAGRFMTPDPGHIGANVGDPQSWNAYVYSNNDPIDFTDPSGLCHVDESGNLVEDEGIPCWMALIGPTTGIDVTAPLEWVPCVDLETGQLTGTCPEVAIGALESWIEAWTEEGGGGGGGPTTGTTSPTVPKDYMELPDGFVLPTTPRPIGPFIWDTITYKIYENLLPLVCGSSPGKKLRNGVLLNAGRGAAGGAFAGGWVGGAMGMLKGAARGAAVGVAVTIGCSYIGAYSFDGTAFEEKWLER